MIYDEDTLKHWGVKGMKWGVRRDRSSGSGTLKKSASNVSKAVAPTLVARFASNRVSKPVAQAGARIYNATKAAKVLGKAGSRQNGDNQSSKKPGRIKQEVGSALRELNSIKKTQNMSKMSTKEIKEHARRLQLENDFKKLAGETGSRSDKRSNKEQYRLRGKMTDQELNRKVDRLRAMSSLEQQSKQATKKQREIGAKLVKKIEPMAVGVVKSKNPEMGEFLSNALKARDAQSAYNSGDYSKAQELVGNLAKDYYKK